MAKEKKHKFVLRFPKRWLLKFEKESSKTQESINTIICEKLAKDLKDSDYLKYHN